MKIEDCKVGMEVYSKVNELVKDPYIIVDVLKSTVKVSLDGYIFKPAFRPHILTNKKLR